MDDKADTKLAMYQEPITMKITIVNTKQIAEEDSFKIITLSKATRERTIKN
jgi:hypothetical protein